MRDIVETRWVSGEGRGVAGAGPKVAVLQLAEGNEPSNWLSLARTISWRRGDAGMRRLG
jgi:hypothetical protein